MRCTVRRQLKLPSHSAKANEMQGGERRGTTYLVQRGVAEDDGALCWTTTLPPLASSFFFFCFLYFLVRFCSFTHCAARSSRRRWCTVLDERRCLLLLCFFLLLCPFLCFQCSSLLLLRPSVQGAVQPETRLVLVRWLANASLCFCLVCFSSRPLL